MQTEQEGNMAIIYMRNDHFYDIKDKQKPLKNAGYTDIKRTTEANAQIEVRGKRGRYFYTGENGRKSW